MYVSLPSCGKGRAKQLCLMPGGPPCLGPPFTSHSVNTSHHLPGENGRQLSLLLCLTPLAPLLQCIGALQTRFFWCDRLRAQNETQTSICLGPSRYQRDLGIRIRHTDLPACCLKPQPLSSQSQHWTLDPSLDQLPRKRHSSKY